MNLAGAYEAIGDLNSAQHAFEQARAVYPISAEVAWNYGNFLLRQGQDAAAYAEIRQAVQSDPRLLRLAVSRVWRARHDVNVLLDQALPADVNAYVQALNFFASIRQTEAALSVWRRLISLGKPVPLQKTFPFFDELILDDRSAEAKRCGPKPWQRRDFPTMNRVIIRWCGTARFRATSTMEDWAGDGILPGV